MNHIFNIHITNNSFTKSPTKMSHILNDEEISMSMEKVNNIINTNYIRMLGKFAEHINTDKSGYPVEHFKLRNESEKMLNYLIERLGFIYKININFIQEHAALFQKNLVNGLIYMDGNGNYKITDNGSTAMISGSDLIEGCICNYLIESRSNNNNSYSGHVFSTIYVYICDMANNKNIHFWINKPITHLFLVYERIYQGGKSYTNDTFQDALNDSYDNNTILLMTFINRIIHPK